jgi:hypothetical protein
MERKAYQNYEGEKSLPKLRQEKPAKVIKEIKACQNYKVEKSLPKL